jgi:hypothetical protein
MSTARAYLIGVLGFLGGYFIYLKSFRCMVRSLGEDYPEGVGVTSTAEMPEYVDCFMTNGLFSLTGVMPVALIIFLFWLKKQDPSGMRVLMLFSVFYLFCLAVVSLLFFVEGWLFVTGQG